MMELLKSLVDTVDKITDNLKGIVVLLRLHDSRIKALESRVTELEKNSR